MFAKLIHMFFLECILKNVPSFILAIKLRYYTMGRKNKLRIQWQVTKRRKAYEMFRYLPTCKKNKDTFALF